MKKIMIIGCILLLTIVGVGVKAESTLYAEEEITLAQSEWEVAVQKLTYVELLAKRYVGDNHVGEAAIRKLALNYVRSLRYTGGNWDTLAGNVDPSFALYVESSEIEMGIVVSDIRNIGNIVAPTGETIDFVHMYATIATINQGGNTNGDVGGWAGDYSTLVKDVKASEIVSTDEEAIYNHAKSLFLGESSFNQPDWTSDLDAYLMMQTKMENPDKSFGEILEQHYIEMSEAKRVYLFTKSRIGNVATQEEYRNAVFAIFEGNIVLTALHMQNVVSGSSNIAYRRATSNVIADYLFGYYAMNEVTDITLGEEVSVVQGTTSQLTYQIEPSTAIVKDVTFVSAKPEIVSIDEAGIMTAHAIGETTITIRSVNGITKSVALRVGLDKLNLESLITEANVIDENLYTPKSYAVFANGLAAVKETILNAATQAEITAATTSLQSGMNSLVLRADFSKLKSIVAISRSLNKGLYVASSWEQFEKDLAFSIQVLENQNSTQAEVDAVYVALQISHTKLEKLALPALAVNAKKAVDTSKSPATGDGVNTSQLFMISLVSVAAILVVSKRKWKYLK